MIRELLISIFFFFGPALVMLMLRNGVLVLRLWLKSRQQRARAQQIIDITPVDKNRAPKWFYIMVVVISLMSAVTVFMHLEKGGAEVHQYVPAHIDASGHIVPGGWREHLNLLP